MYRQFLKYIQGIANHFWYLHFALLLTACATPSELIHKQAISHDFMSQQLISKQFILISYLINLFALKIKYIFTSQMMVHHGVHVIVSL